MDNRITPERRIPASVVPGNVLPAQTIPEKFVPERVIPAKVQQGAWQGGVDRALGPLARAAGAVKGYTLGGGMGGAILGAGAGDALVRSGTVSSENLGRAAGILGQVAGVAGNNADTLGLAASRLPEEMQDRGLQGLGNAARTLTDAGISSGMTEERDPVMPPLSRDTEDITPEFLTQFLSDTAQQPNAIVGQQLVQKLDKAMKAGDMDTMEKLHSDMARLFPDYFEPGNGVNGKLFHPDEQAKAMATLKQLNRMGMVDSIHLAKQRNAFNNPQDSRVLPVTPKMPEQPGMGGNFAGARRTYGY